MRSRSVASALSSFSKTSWRWRPVLGETGGHVEVERPDAEAAVAAVLRGDVTSTLPKGNKRKVT
jgi:hypothetical protein